MSARYWVLVAHEVMASNPQWPGGLRPVKQAEDGPGPSPDCAWWLFEDDGAPATLDGKRVELTFTRSGDKVMIASRTPAT
ncbi:MAG TPA: hypothetical protein VME40_07460 [Caulobacteraceae bacterium]|nr:hypothetical protein [Caulobacteraceae bacterium]